MIQAETSLTLDAIERQITPELDYIGYYQARRGWKSRHQTCIRNLVDLWYVTEGAGSIRINGRWHSFSAHDLVVIKPGEDYQQEKAERNSIFKVYYVFLYPFGLDRRELQQEFFNSWPTILPLKYHPDVQPLFRELFELFTTRSSTGGLLERSILYRILHVTLEAYKHFTGQPAPEGHEKALRARQFIDNHYREALTLDQVAEQVDLSASYLSALFARHFHISPINYQISVKLRAAKLLLAEGTPVTQVAGDVGFNSVHHFSRLFKKHFHVSPSGFARMRHRK